MKSYVVHYKNKFPGCSVQDYDGGLDVYLKDGSHAVALRRDGSGQLVDRSAEYGCEYRHDLSPIPRDARVHKCVQGKVGEYKLNGKNHDAMSEVVGKDELADEREKARAGLLDESGRAVLSIAELKARGWEFDEKGNVKSAGKKVDAKK